MIDQTHALIAHLDVEHLIEHGEVRWSLIHVDLDAGRQGIAAVQAAQAYHALPKFSLASEGSATRADDAADAERTAVEQQAAVEPEPSPCAPAPAATVEHLPDPPPIETDGGPVRITNVSISSMSRRDALRQRRVRMETNAIETGWHAEFLARWQSFGITADSTDDEIEAALDTVQVLAERRRTVMAKWQGMLQSARLLDTARQISDDESSDWREPNGPHETALRQQMRSILGTGNATTDEIEAALDAIEPPFDPDPRPAVEVEAPTPSSFVNHVDDGAPVRPEDVEVLVGAIQRDEHRAVVNGWLAQSRDAGRSWDPRVSLRVRQYEITRAALALATATTGDDQYVRLILATALDAPMAEAARVVVGEALSTLTIAEARRVTALAEAFGNTLHLIFAQDGTPSLSGDVAAVLAAA